MLNQRLGASIGMMAFGPFGAFYGAFIGKGLDNLLGQNNNLQINQATNTKLYKNKCRRTNPSNKELNIVFFNCLFSIMGMLIKQCNLGRKTELKQLQIVMDHMKLSIDLRLDAINQFYNGQQSDYCIENALDSLLAISERRINPSRMIVEILLQSIYMHNKFIPTGDSIIRQTVSILQIDEDELLQIKALVHSYNQHKIKKKGNRLFELNNAYDVLGLNKQADKKEIRSKYKKLMNQHHPDKLISKGFPEELCLIATEKTQEIKNAYELIIKSK